MYNFYSSIGRHDRFVAIVIVTNIRINSSININHVNSFMLKINVKIWLADLRLD